MTLVIKNVFEGKRLIVNNKLLYKPIRLICIYELTDVGCYVETL